MFKWTCPECGFVASVPRQQKEHACAARVDATALHSPLPWRLTAENDIVDATGDQISFWDGPDTLAPMPYDAALIVRAVNNHQALVDALQALVESLNNDLSDEQCAAWDMGLAALNTALAK